MNYWHIQLHPDDPLNVETIKSILTTKQVIGMGITWNNKKGDPVPDPDYFQRDMQIGDVVMVRDGSKPVALTKVISDAYIETNVDKNFDWFTLRRKVITLGFYGNEEQILLNQILVAYGNQHIQAPGTLTCCNGKNATNEFIVQWHKLIIRKTLMENIKLSSERKAEIKALWESFKLTYSPTKKEEISEEIEKLTKEWLQYRAKIDNDTFSIDDYTNRKDGTSATMPGYYLCNFLERTTKTVFGSSKPGNANNFEVKLNSDGDTYTIRRDLKRGDKENKNEKPKANELFNEFIKPLIKQIVATSNVQEKISLIEGSKYAAKQILRKLAVLDNLADFLFMYSDDEIDALHSEFLNSDESTNFGKNAEIRAVANELLDVDVADPVESVILSSFLWKYATSKGIADSNSPNVILYGPPGTGKTYAVKQSIDFICQGDKTRYKFVPFHPSFTYEDFIEGIKPKGVLNGNIKFELVDGIFKRFCKQAKEECIKANQENRTAKSYYFIVDEINRANLSSVFGETLVCIEKEYRHNVSDSDDRNLVKTQYSSLIEDMIKDDAKNETLAYHYQDNNAYFGIPSNVYFIGMMNDVDKSIDAFDLALRRRFKWIRKDCDYDVVENETRFRNGDVFTNIDDYLKACKDLNDFIGFTLNLGKSYEFGHSFFMKIKDIANSKTITKNNIEKLFNLHLKPTLKEYLRTAFTEAELEKKLDLALIEFTKPFSSK